MITLRAYDGETLLEEILVQEEGGLVLSGGEPVLLYRVVKPAGYDQKTLSRRKSEPLVFLLQKILYRITEENFERTRRDSQHGGRRRQIRSGEKPV